MKNLFQIQSIILSNFLYVCYIFHQNKVSNLVFEFEILFQINIFISWIYVFLGFIKFIAFKKRHFEFAKFIQFMDLWSFESFELIFSNFALLKKPHKRNFIEKNEHGTKEEE